jgi:hypothetical protein
MTDHQNQPSRRDRMTQDADTIAGFFGTRTGAIVVIVILATVATLGVISWVTTW